MEIILNDKNNTLNVHFCAEARYNCENLSERPQSLKAESDLNIYC